MSRVYPISIRLTSNTLNPSLAGVSNYYYEEQLKQHIAYTKCIKRLNLIYGLKRLTLKRGLQANLRPAVFPIITQLHARSYLNLQLANSNDWFVNKFLPCIGLLKSLRDTLNALRSLCQQMHGTQSPAFGSTTKVLLSEAKNEKPSPSPSEQRQKASETTWIACWGGVKSSMFMRFGLVLLAYKTKSAKHLTPVPAPIAKLQLQREKSERLSYEFPFLSQADQSVNLDQINLLCRDVVKAVPDEWVLKTKEAKDFSAVPQKQDAQQQTSGLDASLENQLAYTTLKPVSTYVYGFHRPNKLNLFINLTSHLPESIQQTKVLADTIPKSNAVIRNFKTLKRMPFLRKPNGFAGGAAYMDCVNQNLGVHRLKSVARFALTLGTPNSTLRQTLSIRL